MNFHINCRLIDHFEIFMILVLQKFRSYRHTGVHYLSMRSLLAVLAICHLTVGLHLPQTFEGKPIQMGQAPNMDVQEFGLKRPGGSVAVMKTHSVIYKNINGEKEQYEQRKEEVQKNGEMVARVQQELDKSGLNPEPHVKTMLEIPSKNLHRVIEHGPKRSESPSSAKLHRPNVSPSPNSMKTSAKKPFSPLDMAEYVFWTGDERGATSAIEEFLEDGLLTRDEAIGFLEEIKRSLEMLKQQYAADPERPSIQLVSRGFSKKK